MDTFEWEAGVEVEAPYVEIDGTKYYLQAGTYSGGTPVSDSNLNEMQNILNENVTNGFQQKGTILWTNPNPTADFAEQTITLSSSDYDVLEWYCRSDVVNPRTVTAKCLKGYGGQVDIFSTGAATRRWTRRWVSTSNTQYDVYHCYQLEYGQSTQTTNDQCVPLYIVGYKTGLFS